MDADFTTPRPHKEAAQIIAGKPVVVKRVFNELLPEIKARAFTVAAIESANALQRIRDAVAAVPLGDQTWDESKQTIVEELEPFLGDGADYRADLVLRTNAFQAFSTSVHRVGMDDDDTVAFQYLHGECDVPTPSHLALNGLVVPKHDPFWLTHTGPWGHLGCVCYKRPMNPDLVADEQAKDATRNPEDQNVVQGAALTQLHSDTIQRGNVRYNISIDGPDNSGFRWNPDDFTLPIHEILLRYDPDVRDQFIEQARQTRVNGTTLWNWLTGGRPAKRSRAEIARQDAATAAKQTAPDLHF